MYYVASSTQQSQLYVQDILIKDEYIYFDWNGNPTEKTPSNVFGFIMSDSVGTPKWGYQYSSSLTYPIPIKSLLIKDSSYTFGFNQISLNKRLFYAKLSKDGGLDSITLFGSKDVNYLVYNGIEFKNSMYLCGKADQKAFVMRVSNKKLPPCMPQEGIRIQQKTNIITSNKKFVEYNANININNTKSSYSSSALTSACQDVKIILDTLNCKNVLEISG